MNSKRPLAPKFLNKLDDHLLLHKPETWSARTHLVVYYGLLFMAVLAGLCFIVPNDVRSVSQISYWMGFLSLISSICIIVWLIFMLRFNVFKRFGQVTPLGTLKTYLLYFVSVFTIGLFPFVPPAVETIEANIAYSGNEIIHDINTINTNICLLEYDSLKHKWSEDTVIVVNSKTDAQIAYERLKDADLDNPDTLLAVVHPPYQVIDTSELKQKLNTIDSIVKINDTLYVFNECPDYTFLTVSNAMGHHSFFGRSNPQAELLSSRDLYFKAIKIYKSPDTGKLKKELDQLAKKYRYNNQFGWYSYDYYEHEPPVDINSSYLDRLKHRYQLRYIGFSMENIVDRKYWWNSSDFQWQLRFLLYSCLIISLLIFMFRHSTVKTFFLSLLAGIILTILTSLIIAFSHRHGDSISLGFMLFYVILFGALSLTCFASKKRSVVSGISINLFVLTVNFLPLLAVSYYYSFIDKYITINGVSVPFDFDAMYRNLFIAEIAGFVILLILIPTLIHRVYRKWFALPQE